MSEEIRVRLVQATRDREDALNGLLTFEVSVPQWVATEILTHKRIARNFSSTRSQSIKRSLGTGFYMPEVFHEQGQWNSPGVELPFEVQDHLVMLWNNTEETVRASIDHMNLIVKAAGYPKGLAKEEGGRLLPSSQIMRGVLTATEDAWYCFLVLRNSSKADGAMRVFAEEVQDLLVSAPWRISDYHVPFSPEEANTNLDYQLYAMSAAARLARVSAGAPGAPGDGQRGDGDLARDLLASEHTSPFEHIARFEKDPFQSAICSKPDDNDTFGYGWSNLRSTIERWGPAKIQSDFVF